MALNNYFWSCLHDLLSETGRPEPASEWLKLALDRVAAMSLDTDVFDFEISHAQVTMAQLAVK
ncbi:hypothetical protein [Paenibacillus gorillae]|uniref:hypothetical protein n=1 Tax=Paenibacillus gorillae TaxID=1243662 RepID=UPI0004AC55D7|nr:hypothetical protein [Paenibacillus gorillae]